MIPAGLKKWLAIGSGVGLEIRGPRGSESLRVAAVRVRPSGARVTGGFTIEDFPHQPAAAWGADYAAFLGKQGLRHVAATLVLPRHDVIVRQLSLPGVSAKDLAAAVQFQMEGLHPYHDGDVLSSWARLQESSTVLVAIVRREVIERYVTLCSEAGVKIGGFTCSAAAIYSALRLFGNVPPSEIRVSETGDEGVEIYGESPAKAIFAATFDTEPERATALAAAELRIETAPSPVRLTNLLGADPALPYAAALGSACPRLSLSLNLLPTEHRQSSSPLTWIPAAALGSLVLLLAGAAVAFPSFEDRSYLEKLRVEIEKVQPAATRAAALDREIDAVRRRTFLLDDFRRKPKADMDALAEMTKILAPPAWLNSLELNEQQVTVAGETDQAAPLLRTIDASPLFESSEFSTPPIRIQTGEAFRIRTHRQGVQP